MELRHLRYFRMAAEEMNITRAALRLGIAQPPLTQQIKALERELGVELFARVGRRVELTQAGSIFLAEAQIILARVEHAETLARQAGSGDAGILRVGFTGSAAFNPAVTNILRDFRQARPGVDLVVEESRTSDLFRRLDEGALELAFVRPPIPSEHDLAHHAISSERMVVAVPLTHPLAARRAVDLRALRDEAFILYPRRKGHGLSERIVSECERVGFTPRVAQQTPQMTSTINLVAAAIGVAIVPDCMRHLRPDGVRYIRLTGTSITADIVLAHRRQTASPLLRNILDVAGLQVAGRP